MIKYLVIQKDEVIQTWEVSEMVRNDSQLTVRNTEKELNMNRDIVRLSSTTHLNTVHTKMALKNLSSKKSIKRKKICSQLPARLL
jgi:transposase